MQDRMKDNFQKENPAAKLLKETNEVPTLEMPIS
jgi:hypothetical protein